MEKQRTARTNNDMPIPRMTGTRVEGSVKFGRTPEGGCPAGMVFRTAAGIFSMSFGSTLPADMIATSWHEESDFRNGRFCINLICFPWRPRVGAHTPVLLRYISTSYIYLVRQEFAAKYGKHNLVALHCRESGRQCQATGRLNHHRRGLDSGLVPSAVAVILGS